MATHIKIIDHNILPLDPGEEGKKTLLGIDSDQDGIRDDVEIAIFEKYPTNDNNDHIKRKVLLKEAKVSQKMMAAYVAGNDRVKIFEIFDEEFKASGCRSKFFKSTREFYNAGVFLRSNLYNTNERFLADQSIDQNFAGGFFRTPDIDINCINED